ncbi:MAG: sulfopyruvate decarboxylase subunit beta [Acidobacteriota bacterium]|nr:sulfopyruvate decarboxylase subunit beta [Acidobacteriota bacterium]
MIHRADAIAAILARLGDALVVTANGWISREACAARDRPENFYMLGSMGLASSIGLGLALTNPTRRVVVLDGDGNLLMALGTLAMIADQRPGNLVHVVLDNERYGSTGGQRSLSAHVDLAALAHAAGYAHVRLIHGLLDGGVLDEILASHGPSFLLIKVAPTADGDAPRVPHEPEAIARRFRAAVGSA